MRAFFRKDFVFMKSDCCYRVVVFEAVRNYLIAIDGWFFYKNNDVLSKNRYFFIWKKFLAILPQDVKMTKFFNPFLLFFLGQNK